MPWIPSCPGNQAICQEIEYSWNNFIEFNEAGACVRQVFPARVLLGFENGFGYLHRGRTSSFLDLGKLLLAEGAAVVRIVCREHYASVECQRLVGDTFFILANTLAEFF